MPFLCHDVVPTGPTFLEKADARDNSNNINVENQEAHNYRVRYSSSGGGGRVGKGLKRWDVEGEGGGAST